MTTAKTSTPASKYQKLLAEVALKTGLAKESFDKKMNDSLKLLGDSTDVSRVYIFEDSPDGLTTDNAYEWCDAGVVSQIKNLQGISYTDLPSWKNFLVKDKMIVAEDVTKLPKDLQDILVPQNIKSILVFPLYVNEKIKGFVGFDATKKTRQWGEVEVDLLKTVSYLIAAAYERRNVESENEARLSQVGELNEHMTGRELKMIELKNRIKELEKIIKDQP